MPKPGEPRWTSGGWWERVGLRRAADPVEHSGPNSLEGSLFGRTAPPPPRPVFNFASAVADLARLGCSHGGSDDTSFCHKEASSPESRSSCCQMSAARIASRAPRPGGGDAAARGLRPAGRSLAAGRPPGPTPQLRERIAGVRRSWRPSADKRTCHKPDTGSAGWNLQDGMGTRMSCRSGHRSSQKDTRLAQDLDKPKAARLPPPVR